MEKKEYEIEYVCGEMYKCQGKFKDTIGLTIDWCAVSIGFGQLQFYFDTKTGEWEVDDEYMSAEFCKAVLAKWFDSINQREKDNESD